MCPYREELVPKTRPRPNVGVHLPPILGSPHPILGSPPLILGGSPPILGDSSSHSRGPPPILRVPPSILGVPPPILGSLHSRFPPTVRRRPPGYPAPLQLFAHRKKTRRKAQDPHLDLSPSPGPSGPKCLPAVLRPYCHLESLVQPRRHRAMLQR